MAVQEIIREGLDIDGMGTFTERQARVRELLDLGGIAPIYLTRYPHELSGGQRQRIAIARALILQPKFRSTMSHYPLVRLVYSSANYLAA